MARMTNIIIHCSASAFGDVHLIRRWHKERGWRDIGYHFVICNGLRESVLGPDLPALRGRVQQGVPLDADDHIRGSEIGRHTLGYNDRSIGICMVGKGAFGFRVEQFLALKQLVGTLMKNYGIPLENVLGHCETESGRAQGKTCPDFDVAGWRRRTATEWGLA